MTYEPVSPLWDPLTPCTDAVQAAKVLQCAKQSEAAHVFTRLDEADVLQQVRHLQGQSSGSLAGWLVTIKDNLDLAGEVTLAGSVVCASDSPADVDAPVVQRLREAGAVLLGKTNMTEFAFSGVGINPHHGTPANPADRANPRVPGGSSAGAAVSVALGLARAAIGTDTGGSVRIPAALCGLVGFKGTQSRIPLQGVMELSRSLDTVGAITRTVADNLKVDAVLSRDPLPQQALDLRGQRLAVPQTVMLDELETPVAEAFARALSRLSQAGAQLVEIPFAELAEIAPRSQPGGISPVEAFAAHHARLARAPERVDPRVMLRMKLGEGISAKDYLSLLDRRREWIAKAERVLGGFDAMVCPTTPLVAPLIAPLVADDEAFFRVNRLLLRNPSVINYLDGCAFSLPCHAAGDLPVGLMLSAPNGRDAHLAQLALAIEAVLA